MNLTIFSHPDCELHCPPEGYVERPERVQAALRGAQRLDGVQWESAEAVSREELERAHGPKYLDKLDSISASGNLVALEEDTHLGPGSLRAAARAAGAVCGSIDAVMNEQTRRAFAIVRPPGHHAEAARAMGFCLYNNVAIGALHAADEYGLKRVAVCDFDVHHGNGTEAILAGRDGMLFLSSHQSPLYPGTGNPDSPHPDNVVNAVLPPDSGSNEFRELWLEHLLPEVERFQPQLILVSAGFDAHWRDPLAQLKLKEEDYHWIGRQLAELSDRYANGRLVASLEGGYDLEALEESVLAFGEALA